MKRFLKKIFRKDIVQRVRALSFRELREKVFPPSPKKRLMQWEKESKKEDTQRLLQDGNLDPRMLIPVIIFQSGKVGSTSVHDSLINVYRKIGLAVPVFHAHVLQNIDQRIELVRATRVNPEDTINKLLESKELRKFIDSHPEWSWNVISLVRDPVALKVSGFFQLLNEYIPDWQKQLSAGTLTLAALQKLFYEKGGMRVDGLNHWFDHQIKPIWGIDVYGTPFSRERGFQIYRQNPRVNLMIIRLEDLNRVAKDAFYEFLGITDFTIVKTNVGAEKPYSKLYDQFKALPLPSDALQGMYNSRYARHFYDDQELENFCSNWNQV